MDEVYRILVVDDERSSRRLFQTFAEGIGGTVEVVEAATGKEALEIATDGTYDCIYLDYVLPDLDGLQLLRQLKEEGVHAPVVMLTGKGSEPLAVEAMRSGAADYLNKADLTTEVLYRSLQTATKLNQARRQTQLAAENIELARREFEEAQRLQSEFLTRMSHEIRTPLNVILGTTDLLRSTQLTPDQEGYVQTCQRAGHMLMVLINDVLDLSKSRSSELELRNIEFDLCDWFDKTCSMMAVQARGKDLVFNHDQLPGLPRRVKGDPDRLTQILVNLTGNAIKFTRKGTVTVTLMPEPDAGDPGVVRLIVSDTGIGIPEDKRDIIFTSFGQADKSVSHEYGGTGLGLAISKTLVSKMNGRIWVESEVGKGSMFHVTVQFEVPPDRPGSPDRDAGEESEKGITTIAISRGPGRLRILVAEDTFDNRLLVKSFLKRAPIDIDFAFNGRDACDMFAETEYDLIFMDMEMPEMNGEEATRQIREMERLAGKDAKSQTPIVALTAHSFSDEKMRCYEAGCTDFLMKPFKRASLMEKIYQHVSSRRPS